MEFHKWPKIESLENERLRNSRAFQKAWEIENWVVTEKIDGTNIAVNIDHEGFRLSSRNQFVGSDFYGVSTALHQVEPLVEAIQRNFFPDFVQFTLQGEFFGQKVMRRVDYKIPQAFRFFGCYVIHEASGYQRWHWQAFIDVMRDVGYEFMIVPVIGHYRHFEEAIARAEAQASFFNPAQLMEGVVIQPLDMPIEPDGLVFKWKRPDFRENRIPSLKPTDAPSEEISRLNAEFKALINESRIASVVSKIGRPKSITDFKPYASAIFADAWEDFVKEHPDLPALTAGDMKAVRNVGSLAYFTFQKVYAKYFKENQE